MENRKYIVFTLIFSAFLFSNPVFAYEIGTHAFLTKVAVEFYSQKAATSTANNFIDYLVDGSRKEDNVPRWMNHFYDPVYNRGLSEDSAIDPLYILGNWPKSKEWAVNSNIQNDIKYKVPTTIASILSVIQQGKISNFTTETDFNWNKALYYWINGEKEKAMFALGHILHLIQDASVPDHTRNDPHASGSPYENYTEKFTLDNPDKELSQKLTNKNIITLPNLDSYFNEIAKYSNNNFYSKDTIGIRYSLPEPDYFTTLSDGRNYGMRLDSEFGEYPIVKASGLLVSKSDELLNRPLIMSSYWSLLSPKAVQYSASVIDFFFKEAERLKNDPKFVKKESFFAQTIDVVKNVVSIITGTAKDIVSTAKDNAQIQDQNLLASVSLDENNDTARPNEQKIIGPNPVVKSISNNDAAAITVNLPSYELDKSYETNKSDAKKSTAGETNVSLKQNSEQEINENISSSTQNQPSNKLSETSNVQKQNTQPLVVPQTCSFQTTKIPTHQKLLINEVAWMGSVKSSSDEWIELKNISGAEINISNWQILDKEEQIKIAFPENTKVSAGGFLLLERTDDNSVPNVKADIIYTGALSNSDEALRLFDEKCDLIDEVSANSEWPAGETATKRTMERQTDLTWWTYDGAGEGSGDTLILGTPKKENALKVVYSGAGGGQISSFESAPLNQSNQIKTDNNQIKEPSSGDSQPAKILISEVQITGGTGKTNNDFIELYNPNDSRVNLKGYRLVKRTKTGTMDTSIKSWTDDAYIEAKSFYLWANSDYKDISVAPDVTTSTVLANDNSAALRFGAENTGTIIDSVAWGESGETFMEGAKFSANPGANESLQRKIQNNEFIDTDDNANDFEIQTCPSPKAQSKSCAVSEASKSNQAPSAFFDFSPMAPKMGEEIIFNAASSTNSDGNIVLYEWNFGDNQLASSIQATTTHAYSLAGNYNVSLTIFDNLNATSTYVLPISVASSTVQPNEESKHILISEIMPGAGEGRSDEEYVELYNPNNIAIDLAGYSLRKTTSVAAASSTPLAGAANFADKIIPAKGFLLITSLNYSASSTADVVYSSASYGLANNNDQTVLLLNSAGETVDEIYYASISEGKSLERKALFNGVCVSARADGEFLGNGCDINNDESDWEIRDVPVPQNSQNFIEPRNVPIAPQNFSAQYDKPNKKINLSWDASRDYSGATSTLNYLISDISPSSVLGSVTTSSTTAEFNISEIGRDYVFEIKAIDKDGLGSDISTTSVSVPSISIEDVNYLLVNQQSFVGDGVSSAAQVFKPAATGILDSVEMMMGTGGSGWSEVSVSIYEWIGSATSTPTEGKGSLLATSASQRIYPWTASGFSKFVWNFSGEDNILLEGEKYYYLEVKRGLSATYASPYIYWRVANSNDLIDGDGWSGSNRNDLYLVINAVKNGIIFLQEPENNRVYYDSNLNYKIKYVEPVDKKYSSIAIKTSDFYTEEAVSSQTIALSNNEKTIGWHEISGNLNINRPGYFKLNISLSDSIKSEINFSVFGAEPLAGKLLSQNSYSGTSSIADSQFSGQVFRPAVSGWADSLTIMAIANGSNVYHGYNYWSVYEWNGDGNNLTGSQGSLLATTTGLCLTSDSFTPMSWGFPGDGLYLDSNKYYFLTLNKVTNGGQVPNITMKMSDNGSLIDGRLIGQYINQGDLYLILNKKPDN